MGPGVWPNTPVPPQRVVVSVDAVGLGCYGTGSVRVQGRLRAGKGALLAPSAGTRSALGKHARGARRAQHTYLTQRRLTVAAALGCSQLTRSARLATQRSSHHLMSHPLGGGRMSEMASATSDYDQRRPPSRSPSRLADPLADPLADLLLADPLADLQALSISRSGGLTPLQNTAAR